MKNKHFLTYKLTLCLKFHTLSDQIVLHIIISMYKQHMYYNLIQIKYKH